MENVQGDKGSVNQMKQKTIDIEGVSVEDAIKKALGILNVSRDEVNVKIVCEEKKGLFGMEGAKPAKIKVTIKNKENN